MEAYNQAILNVHETILVAFESQGHSWQWGERNEVCFKFVNPGTVIVTIIIIVNPELW